MRKKIIWIASMATIVPSIGIITGVTVALTNNKNQSASNLLTSAQIKANKEKIASILPSKLTSANIKNYFSYQNLKNPIENAKYSWEIKDVDDLKGIATINLIASKSFNNNSNIILETPTIIATKKIDSFNSLEKIATKLETIELKFISTDKQNQIESMNENNISEFISFSKIQKILETNECTFTNQWVANLNKNLTNKTASFTISFLSQTSQASIITNNFIVNSAENDKPPIENKYTKEEISGFYAKFGDAQTQEVNISPESINTNNLNQIYKIPNDLPNDIKKVFNNFQVLKNSTQLSFDVSLFHNDQLLGKKKTITISGFIKNNKPVIQSDSKNFITPKNQEEIALLGSNEVVLRKRFQNNLMPYLISSKNYLNYLIFSYEKAEFYEKNKYLISSTSYDLVNGTLQLTLISSLNKNKMAPINLSVSDFFSLQKIDNSSDTSEIFLSMFKMDKWYKSINPQYYTNQKVFNKQFQLRSYFLKDVEIIPYDDKVFAYANGDSLSIKIKIISSNEIKQIKLSGFNSTATESVPSRSLALKWKKSFDPSGIKNKGVDFFVSDFLLKKDNQILTNGSDIFNNFQTYFDFLDLPYSILGYPVSWEFQSNNSNNQWFVINNAQNSISATLIGKYNNKTINLELNTIYPLNFIDPNTKEVDILNSIGFKEKDSSYIITNINKDNFLNYFDIVSLNKNISSNQLKEFITVDSVKLNLKIPYEIDTPLDVKISFYFKNKKLAQKDYQLYGLSKQKINKNLIKLENISTSWTKQIQEIFKKINNDTKNNPLFCLKDTYSLEAGEKKANYYNGIDATNVNETNFSDMIAIKNQSKNNDFFAGVNKRYYIVYKNIIKYSKKLFSFKMIIVDRFNPLLFYSDNMEHFCTTSYSRLKSYEDLYQKLNTEILIQKKENSNLSKITVLEAFNENNLAQYFKIINPFETNIELSFSPSKQTNDELFNGAPLWYSDANKGSLYVRLRVYDKNSNYSGESQVYYKLTGFKSGGRNIGDNFSQHSITDLIKKENNIYIRDAVQNKWYIKQNLQSHYNDNNWKIDSSKKTISYRKNFNEFKKLVNLNTKYLNIFLAYEINDRNFKIDTNEAAINDKQIKFTIDFNKAINQILNQKSYIVNGSIENYQTIPNFKLEMYLEKENIVLKISTNDNYSFHNKFDFKQNDSKAILTAISTIRIERHEILNTDMLNWIDIPWLNFDYQNSEGIIGGNRHSITLKENIDKNDPWKLIKTKNLTSFAPDQFALNKGFVPPYSEITKSMLFPLANQIGKRVISGGGTLTMLSKVLPSNDNDYRYYLITNQHVIGNGQNFSPEVGFAIPPISNDEIDGRPFPMTKKYGAQVFWRANNVENRMKFRDNKNQILRSNEDVAIVILDIKPILDAALGIGTNSAQPDFEVYKYLSNWKNLPPLKFGSGFSEFITNQSSINQGLLEIGFPDKNFNIRKYNTTKINFQGSGNSYNSSSPKYGKMNTQLITTSIAPLPLYISGGASGSAVLNEKGEIIGLRTTGKFGNMTTGNINLLSTAFIDYIGTPKTHLINSKSGTFYEKLLESSQREPEKFELIDMFNNE